MPNEIQQEKIRATEDALVCSGLEIAELREKLEWVQEIATVAVNGHPVHGAWSHGELIRTLQMIHKGAGEVLSGRH